MNGSNIFEMYPAGTEGRGVGLNFWCVWGDILGGHSDRMGFEDFSSPG